LGSQISRNFGFAIFLCPKLSADYMHSKHVVVVLSLVLSYFQGLLYTFFWELPLHNARQDGGCRLEHRSWSMNKETLELRILRLDISRVKDGVAIQRFVPSTCT